MLRSLVGSEMCIRDSNTGRTRPRFVARLARSVGPQSRGPCPRADPPSPRPSRSASEVARSRLRGLPHAPYVFARTPVPIYCYLLLLLGLLPYLLPSNRLIIAYSYHYTYHVLLVITILLLVVRYLVYITKTRCLLIYWPQYVHTYLQSYTLVCCACRVKLWMTKGVVFFFPYRTAIRGGLTYIYWAQYVCTCSTRPYTMHGCVCPVESRMTKRVVFYCFDHYE